METAEVLAMLNAYDGDDVWIDVICGLPGFEPQASMAMTDAASRPMFLAAGAAFVCTDGHWDVTPVAFGRG